MSNEKSIAIKVAGVSKTFKLPHEKNSSLKSALVNTAKNKRSYELQKALENVSFEVKKGEFFGVVGKNGSGKSTLLKILAGIYSPDNGKIDITGKLTPFIELGVGFNPELTGRENVFLNGALLGFSRKEMAAMYDDIVAFAEIERFMDQKLKNYSSGMQVRLAFSIAIRAKTDILVLDEVLAVGDENFQKKCKSIFRQIKNSGTTVVFVSHDMASVEQFCDSAILMENGKNIFYGKSSEVARRYEELNRQDDKKTVLKPKLEVYDNHETVVNAEGLGLVDIELKILNATKQQIYKVDSEDSIVIESTIIAKEDISNALHSFTFEDESGGTISLFTSNELGLPLFNMKKGEVKKIKTTIDNIFKEGTYYIDPDVSTLGRETIYGHVDNAASIDIVVHKQHNWLLRPSYSMKGLESPATKNVS